MKNHPVFFVCLLEFKTAQLVTVKKRFSLQSSSSSSQRDPERPGARCTETYVQTRHKIYASPPGGSLMKLRFSGLENKLWTSTK